MRFEPVDRLCAIFGSLIVLGGLLRFDRLEQRWTLVPMILAALLPIAMAAVRARYPHPARWLEIVLDFYVIVCVLVFFDNLGPYIRALNPHDQDAALIAFDRFLFGVDPTVALERLATPLLSDVLTICYALYYFHPIVLGGLIYADDLKASATGAARRFRQYGFTMVFVFFVSYAGYFIVPAIGPRFTIQHAGPLPRGTISRVIDQTLDKLEKNKRNCFPSGHTMVTVAVLVEAARRSRKTMLAFVPFAIGLLCATVYGRYHYATDVLGGLLLVPITLPLAWWMVPLGPSTPRSLDPLVPPALS